MQLPKTKRKMERLGDETELTFAEALNAAVAWFDAGGKATLLSSTMLTLRVVASQYLNWRYNNPEKSDDAYHSTKSLFDCHIFSHPIAERLVTEITTEIYQDWLNELGDKLVSEHSHPDPEQRYRLGRNTANTVWTFVKAALNRANKTHKTLPVGEWKAVETLEGGETEARGVWLTEAQVIRLVNVIDDEGFRDLVLAGAATGARLGELKAMKVRDLDLDAGRWWPSKSKVKKKGRKVRILDPQTVDLLRRRCAGKLPTDYVFTYQGEPWTRQHLHLMRKAVDKAKLDPATVYYSLRHAYISKQVKAGVSTLLIAKNCGTSVKQIEDHYGHFADDEKRRMLAQGAMKLPMPESNVTSIA